MSASARVALLAALLLVALTAPQRAAAVSLKKVASGNFPVYVTTPPGDPRLFVVERGGTIQVVHDGVETPFLDIHAMVDQASGERGMSSMVFDPNYATNGLFYVFFSGNGSTDSGGTLGDVFIDEYHVSSDPNVADPASRRTVWTFAHANDNHYAGQLQFGPDGLLYISAGDNEIGANARSPDNPYGKVLRIDPHGEDDGDFSVPASNPFPTAGAPETWSFGMRNPYRFSFDYLTGDLVIADVGLNEREEIDYLPASSGAGFGVDLGWNCREGFIAGPASCTGSFTDPVFDYPHDDPGGDQAWGCAIIGGFVYRGSEVPELFGRYVYTDFCNAELRSSQLGLPLASGDRSEGVELSNATSIGQDSDCELYVTDGTGVYKIKGSLSGSVAPGCRSAPASAPPEEQAQGLGQGTSRGCRARPKRHGHATAARKRKKLCARVAWTPRV